MITQEFRSVDPSLENMFGFPVVGHLDTASENNQFKLKEKVKTTKRQKMKLFSLVCHAAGNTDKIIKRFEATKITFRLIGGTG